MEMEIPSGVGTTQVTEEARNVFLSENTGNAAALSGERIMESVGSPEEEVRLNTYVLAPNIITYRYQIRLPRKSSKLCHGKRRERRRRENLLCQKSTETPQLYLER